MAVSIDFAVRLKWVADIKKAHLIKAKAAGHDDEAASFAYAQQAESDLADKAISETDYVDDCVRLIASLAAPESDVLEAGEIMESIWANLAQHDSIRKMGRYAKLVSHKNGRFSTVYKALRIADEPATADSGLDGDWEDGTTRDWSVSRQAMHRASPEEIDRAVNGDHKVYALKVTMPSLMRVPHDSRREIRILTHLQTNRMKTATGDQAVAEYPHLAEAIECFRYNGDEFTIVFPFFPFNLQDFIDSAAALAAKSGPATPSSRRDAAASAYRSSADLESGVLTGRQVRSCFRDVFSGLVHVHAAGIIHRDIKPSNILLRSPNGPACIADFGISWLEGDPTAEVEGKKIIEIGTEQFRAPELLFGDRGYDTGVDLWAAGCMVAEVENNGKSLFDAGDLGSDLRLIQSIFTTLGTPDEKSWPDTEYLPDWGKLGFAVYDPLRWSEILPGKPADFVDFVSRLIRFPRAKRMKAVEALEHPYLQLDP